jgi:2-dehydropantoate 2-reductase
VDRASQGSDVALICVRYEDLDGVVPRLSDTSAAIVVLTPMMPPDRDRFARALGRPVIAGMPSVLAYENSAGAIRYWLPRVATTWIERVSPPGPGADFVQRLTRSGIGARLDFDVLARNAATTVSFVPLSMALDVGGSVDAVLTDSALLSLALEAAAEGRELGRVLGKAEAWASTLLRFAGPLALRLGVGVVRSRSPEIIGYVEKHFGRKLHAQNVVMAERIVELATERGTRRAALTKLLARLRR